MEKDTARINHYLAEIRKNSLALNALIEQNELRPDSVPLKAAKYILIELAEGIARVIQDILTRDKGVVVSGYLDTIRQGHEHGLLTDHLYTRLKPCVSFRNSLMLRYWILDDQTMIAHIHEGRQDFDLFVERIAGCMKSVDCIGS